MKYRYPSSISTPEARKVYRRLMRKIKKLQELCRITREPPHTPFPEDGVTASVFELIKKIEQEDAEKDARIAELEAENVILKDELKTSAMVIRVLSEQNT